MDSADVDSLHILPLHDMPIASKPLRSARLVKNARLKGMLELFKEKGAGSGQLSPDGLSDFFDFSGDRRQDYEIINQLGALPSYDVYSLRVSLRDFGIDVSKLSSLKLSAGKTEQLTHHMGEFTMPLVRYIYGEKTVMPLELPELLHMFVDPDATVARENLTRMASVLEVDLMRIPRFLEDYADVFMSLCFYRQCLEDIAPMLASFLNSLQEIRSSGSFGDDRTLIKDCYEVERKLSVMFSDVAGVLDEFRRQTERMWESPTAASYRAMEALIASLQTRIGEVLCALTVKMLAWTEKFPPEAGGQLSAKAAFVISEMKYGLGGIRSLSLKTEQDDRPDDREADSVAA